jgi:hypothetical protein
LIAVVLYACLYVSIAPGISQAQAKPYTLQEVANMLEGNLSMDYVLEQVRANCIAFNLDEAAANALRQVGGSNEFLASLRSTCRQSHGHGLLSPGGAAIRSLLIPGLGQFYTGRPVLGAAFLSAGVGSLALGVLSKSTTVVCAANGVDECPANQVISETSSSKAVLGAAGMVAVGVVAALEARAAAKRLNVSAARVAVEERRMPSEGLHLELPLLTYSGADIRLDLIRIRF